MTQLNELKARISRLDAQQFEPVKALMTLKTWEGLQAEFIDEMGWTNPRKPTGGEVLGIPVDVSGQRSAVVIICKGLIEAAAANGAVDELHQSPAGEHSLRASAGPVFRLIYASEVASCAALQLGRAMRDILSVSTSLNRRDGISGMLVSDGRRFVQVLEGQETLVEDCYARIVKDSRNSSPLVRLRETGPEHLFPRWSMCGVTLSHFDDALLARPHIPSDVFRAPSGWLLQMLQTLAERHGPELDAVHKEYAPS